MELVDQSLELPKDNLPNVSHISVTNYLPRETVSCRAYCVRNVGEGAMFYTGHDIAASDALCKLLPRLIGGNAKLRCK